MELRNGFSEHSKSLPDLVQEKLRALTVRELATLLHVSERLIYRMAADAVIPSFRVCGSVRFDPNATAAWLRRSMTSPVVMQSNPSNFHDVSQSLAERRMPDSLTAGASGYEQISCNHSA
jgi:excisionase family DNA binding protein